MFSQVFNKAKGIFSKRDLPASASEDSSVTARASPSDSADSTDKSTSTITEMVTTRQGHVGSPRATDGLDSAVNGKRRIQERKSDAHSTKRRRISSEHEHGLIEELSSPQQVPEDKVTVEITGTKKRKAEESPAVTTTNTPSNEPTSHIRFGSEEPALPIRTANAIENHESVAPGETPDSEEEEDDGAPEVVDNSAQLLSLKVQAQKQREAKKRDEILQKEKRKLQDEKHKAQAKASAKPKAEKIQKTPQSQSIDMKPMLDDDLVSESTTATLLGSVMRESGRRALPALLPDEILNAEPIYRLPSPPPEQQQQKSTRVHKFFKDVDKPAKDLHRGDVTIRVLEDKKNMLPPKSSNSGRNLKASWMAGQRSRNTPGGLKRVGGGPKSFVRR